MYITADHSGVRHVKLVMVVYFRLLAADITLRWRV